MVTERKRATARGALLEAPRIAHAYCPCQDDLPDDQARPVCDTKRGRGAVAGQDADHCAVCVEMVRAGSRWCGHG